MAGSLPCPKCTPSQTLGLMGLQQLKGPPSACFFFREDHQSPRPPTALAREGGCQSSHPKLSGNCARPLGVDGWWYV